MNGEIRVTARQRDEPDLDKLALALLRILQAQQAAAAKPDAGDDAATEDAA